MSYNKYRTDAFFTRTLPSEQPERSELLTYKFVYEVI